MRKLIKDCHESEGIKKRLKQRAFELFKALVKRNIIEFIPPAYEGANKLRINLDLQSEFSLNQTLSLYLIDTLSLIDPYKETYALEVLSLAEAICEDPNIILQKQLDKIKTLAMAEMKQDGIPFEERIAKLEEMEYPKPMREFIYDSFNKFAGTHPWIDGANISPKSIAREMIETFSSFNDLIVDYGLERNEGTLLRYLSEVYKVLTQTIPTQFKNEELAEIITFLGLQIKEIDSSLLDEWERLKDPKHFLEKKELQKEEKKAERNILSDMNEFTHQVRIAIFKVVQAFSRHNYENLPIENQADWPLDILEGSCLEEERILLTPEGRNKKHTHIKKWDAFFEIEQILVDEYQETEDNESAPLEERESRSLLFHVNFEESKKLGRPHLCLIDIRQGDLSVRKPEKVL
jgi:hypothetical protein